jgi:hypothetical protein
MIGIYEAVVVTSDGTYRAAPVSPTLICITEDGVEGVTDFIEVEEAQTAPECLTPTLVAYGFERLRGLSIVTATLTRRKA